MMNPDEQRLSLTQTEINQALLLKLSENLGFSYQVYSDNNEVKIVLYKKKNNLIEAVEDNLVGEEHSDPMTQQEKSRKPIEVPRDSDVGNKILAKRCTSRKAHPGRYLRLHMSNTSNHFDKKSTWNEIGYIVSLRSKEKDSNPEVCHTRKMMANKHGDENITKLKVSWKEMIFLYETLKEDYRSALSLCKFIFDKYHTGYDTFGALYQVFVDMVNFVYGSELTGKYIKGEVVDMSFSIRYFKDIKKPADCDLFQEGKGN